MVFNTVSPEVLLLCLLAVNVVLALLYAKYLHSKAGRHERNANAIARAIIDYFRRSGVEVAVGCTSLDGQKTYTAFIESEPMKRFRLSHIIEATLSEHVQKTCNLELEKIYWRFPIKEGALVRAEPDDTTRELREPKGKEAEPAKPAAVTDDYINEGLVHYKHLPKGEVTELSWEKFQEVSTMEADKKKVP